MSDPRQQPLNIDPLSPPVGEIRELDAARESEGRFRALVSATWDVVYRMSPDWTEMRFLLGREFIANTDEPIRTWLDKYIYADDQPRVTQAIREAIRTKSVFQLEHRVLRVDGSLGWTQSRAVPLLDSSGEIVEWFGAASDVTARKQAEEREAFVRQASGVGFWYCDLPFDALVWDDLVKEHFHLPSDAAVTIDTFYDRMHPDDREPTRRAIEQSIADRTAYDTQYRTVDPVTGAVKWIRAIARTVYDANGTPIRFDGVTLDVTSQREAEQASRESEQRFRLLFNSMDEGFCIIEFINGPHGPLSDYVHVEANPAYATNTGIANVVGQRVREMVPDEADEWVETYRNVLLTGKPIRFERELVAAKRHLELAAFRVEPPEQQQVAVLFKDITERKRAEEALKDADRRKDEFLATLAHELRNPLAPLRNGLEVMKLVPNDSNAVEQARSMMERQLGQLVHLIDDLLDLSRISRGKVQLRKERLPLANVIQQAVETSRPLIDQSGHDLTLDVPAEPIYVRADATRLAQVISNLLNNAAKYTDRGGHVSLKVERLGDDVVLRVRDTGVGIPAQMLPKVFDMFTQIDRSLDRSQGGLGIGLSLVKKLLEMHGGTVEAQSDGQGLGSEFIVRLPVAMTASRSKDKVEPVKDAAAQRRILVVDDNHDAATSLAMMLKLMGNETQAAHDGFEAIDSAAVFRPDLIFLDIGMPRLNGYETAKRIREEPWGKNIMLVALTGWGQEEDRRKSEQAGFDSHLVKPIELATLKKLLSELATSST